MIVLALSMLNVVFNTMPVAANPRSRVLCRNHAKWRAMEMSFFIFSLALRKFPNSGACRNEQSMPSTTILYDYGENCQS